MLKKNVPNKSIPKATPKAPVAQPKPAPKSAPKEPVAPVIQPKPAPKVETKAPEVAVGTMVMAPRLDVMIRERMTHFKATENKIKKLQEQLEATKKEAESILRDTVRLRKIRNMTNLIEQPYMWHMTKRPASELNKYAWREDYKYKTATMEFYVELSLSTTGRKYKYVVEVGGRKVEPGINEGDLGIVDYQYIKNKYMTSKWNAIINMTEWFPRPEYNLELEKGYETEAEARKAVKEWQARLVKDHSELLAEEIELFNECKG